MTRVSLCAVVTIAAALSASALAQQHDGRWEITMEMSMPGMPMNMPPMTITRCVTAEQAQDPQKSLQSLLEGGPNQNKCTLSDFKMDNGKGSWKMTCPGPNAMSGTGEVTYKENAFESVMNMEGQGHTMVMKSTGKRIGDCVK